MGENMSKRNPMAKVVRNPIFRTTLIPAAKKKYKRKKVSVGEGEVIKEEGERNTKKEGEQDV